VWIPADEYVRRLRWTAGIPTQPQGIALTTMDAYLSVHSIVIAAPEQVSCPLGEESAILNLKNTVYYGLNPVGTRVWDLLQKPRSIGQLRDALLEEYHVESERCERDLLDLLEKMRTEGLIEVRSAAAC
jgi:Coenzyme PQQ synthesis protein D (PqqD)